MPAAAEAEDLSELDCQHRLGADTFIDRGGQPFEEQVHDMDVVFDTVGGDIFQRAFRTLKTGGFLVTAVAFPDGEGERYGVGVGRVVSKPNAGQLAAIGELVQTGRLRPRVGKVLPLAEVREALDLSEKGRAGGKIVLRIAG